MIDPKQWFVENEVLYSVYDAGGTFLRFDIEPMLAALAEAVRNEDQVVRRYGALKDTPDSRDKLLALSAVPLIHPATLPVSASEQASLGPVRDQASEQSCDGHGWAGFADWLFRRYGVHHYSLNFSPQFIYYEVRKLEGTLPVDNGAQIRTGAKVLNQIGVALEADDPYSPATLNTPPTKQALVEAKKYKAGAYHRITDVTSARQCLASGYCFVIGIVIFESFEGGVGKSGDVPMPKSYEKMMGGHCVMAFGYDDQHKNLGGSLGAFQMRNSWGEKWGDHGNFWLPYEYVNKHTLDMWVAHFGRWK